MTDFLVETSQLTKKYHHFTALENVSIALKPGKIYGLIGRNGAGKTTFMRLLTGLTFPSSGSLSLFGKQKESTLHTMQKKIGCLIENPSIIPYLTGKENIILHKKLRGVKEKNLEDKILKTVGLQATNTKKAKDYSLGMKQRLGIGIALLNQPELLILDEPINGLDPVGVTEIRELLRHLMKDLHMTILISSHNLPELDQIATDYIIVNNGKVIKEITAEELDQENQHYILLGSSNSNQLVSVLKRKRSANFRLRPDGKVEYYDDLDRLEFLSKTLTDSGIILTTFFYQEKSLEDYFLSLVGGDEK